MRVVVVGGGLAGLFTASELLASGVDDLLVVEAAADPGGVTRTMQRDGFSLEPAAGSFTLPHPDLSPILERAGVRVEPARAASVRHVYVDGRLVALQPSPAALLAPVLSPWAKLRALAEPVLGRGSVDEDESLDAFCRRRFGDRAGRLLASLMASGVFAGDPKELSTRDAFGVLATLERESGSVLRGAIQRRRARSGDMLRPQTHVPVGGMSALARTIAGSLGRRLLRNFEVESARFEGDGWLIDGPRSLTANTVVLAVRPERAADILGGPIGEHLRRSTAAPVVVVGLGGMSPSPLPGGFGALMGPDEDLITVGALFESSYAPGRSPPDAWLVKVIAGGATNPAIVDWEDDRIVSTVVDEMSNVLGKSLSPSFVELNRHRPGIPQYVTGHGQWLASLDDLAEDTPGLIFTGWGYRGVGVASLATDAVRMAKEVSGDTG